MKTEKPISNPASRSAHLPELNRAFSKAARARDFAECDRLKIQIDAVLDDSLRALRLRHRPKP